MIDLDELIAKAEAAKELADQATPGPWRSDFVHESQEEISIPGGLDHCTVLCNPFTDPDDVLLYGQNGASERDGEFIADARVTVPELADAVLDLASQNYRLHAAWIAVNDLVRTAAETTPEPGATEVALTELLNLIADSFGLTA